jgi:hypothetical protein
MMKTFSALDRLKEAAKGKVETSFYLYQEFISPSAVTD